MNSPTDKTDGRVVPVSTAQNVRYDSKTEELAFELWALACDRNVARMHATLQRDYPDIETPDIRTLYRWAANWGPRADKLISELAPEIANRTIGELFTLLPAAKERIAEAVRGELRDLMVAAVDDDGNVVARVKVDPRLLKLEREYVAVLLQVIGAGALGWRGRAEVEEHANDRLTDLAEMSTQDAARALADILKGKQR